ncbi:hypothetical protein FX988_04232 [Paraglaciecola mesophila]|uniref:N-acetyltransferase domain-containing protein n=2 Tax=Paraglaciecola mesophila TaxID=197222 RepID=A0A857JS24_9ALTE|nr:hypothetical protein FX988_04232 [Paraglaciecola mesophila]
MYFYIQDVIVDPEYQGQGLGDKVMFEIETYLQATCKTGATIGLFSAANKEGFYLRYGYLARPTRTLGSGMYKTV